MKWGIGGIPSEFVVKNVVTQLVRKTKETPSVINTTHYIDIRFILVTDPIFEYDAYYTQPRDINALASEHREFLKTIDDNLEDVDLPPNND